MPAKSVDQAAERDNPPPDITIHPTRPGSAPQVVNASTVKPSKPPITASSEKLMTNPIAEITHQDAAKVGYFLQVGAYKSSEDAERQKGNLAIQSSKAKVTQHEASGTTMYHARLGPLNSLDEMIAVRGRLQSAGMESSVTCSACQ